MRLTSALFLFCAVSFTASVREIRIEPQVAYLHGAGAAHRLLLTAVYDDGTARDITTEARITFDAPAVVEAASAGEIKALKEGIAKIGVQFSGRRAEGVAIVQPRRSLDIDFVHDVAPIFSRMGCNNTTCHGSLNGQKGFKLSLFGYDT